MTTDRCSINGCWTCADTERFLLRAGTTLFFRMHVCKEHLDKLKRDFGPYMYVAEIGVHRKDVTFDRWMCSLRDLIRQYYPNHAPELLQDKLIRWSDLLGDGLRKLYDDGKTQCEAFWYLVDKAEIRRVEDHWDSPLIPAHQTG